jgi:stage V sporulation protein AD
VIVGNFRDLGVNADYYDLIITGDLGSAGIDILTEIVGREGYDISHKITDCGIEIFDNDLQDTHCGGSGCACSAITFAGYFYPKIKKGEIRRVLFIPTGALMNPSSLQQGENIPSVAHGLVIERA